MREEDEGGLFETRRGKGRLVYRVFAATVLLAICIIWFYRVTHVPTSCRIRRWGWIGLLAAELWFGMYWILTQASRWNPTYRRTLKDRLSQRYGNDLPGVDVFVCTADPTIEPPLMVVNTVLSLLAYDYPPEKLSVYLSDDAGSELTYFALLEASHFAKQWIPFCKEFKIEPRSPATYWDKGSPFGSESGSRPNSTQLLVTKKLYEDMKHRVESACKLGRVPDDVRTKHEAGFAQWASYSSSRDHSAVVQILIDREELKATDSNGHPMPTLVYMAREKRHDYFHNFKAGAMNALIRVSSRISDGDIILNVDCDMYSNNSQAIRDALCFFMDERRGHEYAFVQFPQNFDNVTKNELYGSSLRVISEVEFHGLDGYEGPMYIGSGCFHRRDILCGKSFNEETKDSVLRRRTREVSEVEPRRRHTNELNHLASCTFEKNTTWGTEIGLRYGVPVEDFITGLLIQCKGWKSVYYNPPQKAFLGHGATTLLQSLVMHKRWSEGDLQIFFSKFSPIWYGLGRLRPGLIMGYLTYCLWAPNCFATLYYVVVPSVYLWRGISLFPEVSSPWFVPFAYVILARYGYSLVEFLMSGGTVLGWWNDQRMWLYKRTSSYLFAFIDTIVKLLGFSDIAFVISPKVTDDDVSIRYEKELMEFGAQSPMLTIITTVALLNLICFIGFGIRTAVAISNVEVGSMFLQGMLCLVLVLINLPIYKGVFFRKDGGKMHVITSVTSMGIVISMCSCFSLL